MDNAEVLNPKLAKASNVSGHCKKNHDKTKKLEKWKGYLIHTNQKDFTL
jgi:hypothetical protein